MSPGSCSPRTPFSLLERKKAPASTLCACRGFVASQMSLSSPILHAVRTDRKLPSEPLGSLARRPLRLRCRGPARVGVARGALIRSAVRRAGEIRGAFPRQRPRQRARRGDGAVGRPGLRAAGLHVRPDPRGLLPGYDAGRHDEDVDPSAPREREEEADHLVEEADRGRGRRRHRPHAPGGQHDAHAGAEARGRRRACTGSRSTAHLLAGGRIDPDARPAVPGQDRRRRAEQEAPRDQRPAGSSSTSTAW